ncbi:MAG: hypothetical protein ILP12_06835 [Lachnospiraceae bacterium]|nr:hypothetical protein [Lachnospiraceae bacterium]
MKKIGAWLLAVLLILLLIIGGICREIQLAEAEKIDGNAAEVPVLRELKDGEFKKR